MGIAINKCVKCGHEWPQSTPTPPRRCPAAGCRTVKWKASSDELKKLAVEFFNRRAKQRREGK
jgi:predicted  nucleic acid-binding Zn-ribbon protein